MASKKIVLCGCQQLGVTLIDQLFFAGIKIDHIVTISQEKADRLSVSGYVSYETIATKFCYY
jgi:hypothetical protein